VQLFGRYLWKSLQQRFTAETRAAEDRLSAAQVHANVISALEKQTNVLTQLHSELTIHDRACEKRNAPKGN
jgi:hypothetical protein